MKRVRQREEGGNLLDLRGGIDHPGLQLHEGLHMSKTRNFQRDIAGKKKKKKFSKETWRGREPPGTGTHRSVRFVCHGTRWSGVKNPRSKLESNQGGGRGCARSRKSRAGEERREMRRLLIARSAGHRQSGCSGSNGMGWTLIGSSLGPEKAHIPCTSFFLFPKKKKTISLKKREKTCGPFTFPHHLPSAFCSGVIHIWKSQSDESLVLCKFDLPF